MATPPNSAHTSKSTQNSLLISEIKDGVVVLKDGSIRGVVLGSSINFDLMSPQEQDAVEFSFQNFINSLHFPIQIVVQSHRIDLDPYLEKLGTLRQEQPNELLGFLMEDYIANIRALVDEVNIMDKQFYVVVPYFPPVDVKSSMSLINGLKEAFQPTPMITISEADYQAARTELSQRMALVTSGLTQVGIRAIALGTQELIDLYYGWYNPEVAASEKLIDASQLTTPAVQKGEGAAPRGPLPGAKF